MQNNTGDSLENSARAGARVGTKAARAIKNAKKAKAAGGAVKAVAGIKNAKIIAIVVAVALFSLILVCVFYAGPMAIFERLGGFSEKLNEVYETEYYGADINNGWQKIAAGLRAFLKGLDAAISDIWASVSGQTSDGNGGTDKDTPDDNDLLVMGEEEPLRDQYQKKVDAVKDKYSARVQHLKDSVLAQSSALSAWVGENDFPRDKASYLEEETRYESMWNNVQPVYRGGQSFRQGYSTDEDMFVVEYGGLNLSVSTNKMTSNQAVDLIALATAQMDNDVQNISPQILMKWMGYYGSGGEGPQITSIGQTGIGTAPLAKLDGLFAPQYILDEKAQNPDGDYSRYLAPAVDALIEFRSPNFYSLAPMIEDVETQVWVTYYYPEYVQTGYGTKDVPDYSPAYAWFYTDTNQRVSVIHTPLKYRYGGTPSVNEFAYSTNRNRRCQYRMYYVKSGSHTETDYSNPQYEWQQKQEDRLATKKIKVITYTANCSIYCRNIRILTSMVHFYDGEELLNAEAEEELEAAG